MPVTASPQNVCQFLVQYGFHILSLVAHGHCLPLVGRFLNCLLSSRPIAVCYQYPYHYLPPAGRFLPDTRYQACHSMPD
jgi:hypothetical protein